jgi:hypothetical protein
MKTKLLLIVVGLFLTVHQVMAQKDVPIAGNAATLLDLLKKDYNSIDPDTRGDELLKDRNQAIELFKAFLTSAESQAFKTKYFSTEMATLKTALDKYNKSKKEITAISTISITVSDSESIRTATAAAKERTDKAEDLKSSYQSAQAAVDIKELVALEAIYVGDSNHFISEIIKMFYAKYDKLNSNVVDPYAIANTNTSMQKSLPFIGGALNFTTFVDGLSKFLAKRIKEELTTYAMTEISKLLKAPASKDPFAEIKILLPRTTQYLQTFTGDKISNFPAEIKQYIESDLDHILVDAMNLKNTPRIAVLISKYPDLDFAFEALEMIPNLSKIKQPVDYFSLLGSSRNLQRWKSDPGKIVTYNLGNAISLMELLAYSTCIIDNGEMRFAGSDFWSGHASEPNFLMLYLGFLYQQNEKYYTITFQDAGGGAFSLHNELQTIVSALAPTPSNMEFFQYLLTELGKNGEKVYNSALDIKKASKNGGKISADTIHSFVTSVVDLSKEIAYSVDTLIYYFNSSYPNRYNLKKITEPYLFVAATANDVVYDFQKKKYADGLISLLSVVDHFTGEDKNVDVVVTINNLNTLASFPSTDNWKLAVTNIETLAANVQLSDADARRFFAVADDLGKLQSFIITNNITVSTNVKQGIIAFKTFAQSACATKNIDITDPNFAKVRTLLADADFKMYVVSFLLNVNINALADKVKDQMDTFSYRDGKNKRLVFEAADAERFKFLLISMANEQFKSLIEDNHTTPDAQQADALFKFIGFYLADYIKWLPFKVSAQINPQVISLIHFANDLAQAQNSDDIENAIESFALPAGSYAIKRTAHSNFSLNSYPGLLLAREFSYSTNTNIQAWSAGFTAPVGLNYTVGTASGYSYGIFLPVMDIGAVTRLRLSDAHGAKALPDLTFSNLFSPGVYFSFGFKNAPFSINIGGQYGPQLKQFVKDQPQYLDSFRLGVGFVLDIPLFNLSTKPRIQ